MYELILNMKKKYSDEGFQQAIEMLRRRVNKGLLTGFTEKDIDTALDKIYSDDDMLPKNPSENPINTQFEIAQLNQDIDRALENIEDEQTKEDLLKEQILEKLERTPLDETLMFQRSELNLIKEWGCL